MRRSTFLSAMLLLVLLFALPAYAELPKAPVKIGVVLPTSGAIAYDGNLALNGIKMAVDEINKNGGIKGN
ncbi:MAG TPA: ABC transporter substrate-binding protein, partial [Synergistaceae bacterium]|nr:ABC transporter substrate-binding protein [Synergistaceae bacterium]